jgi:hypothetical protein
MDLLKLGGHIMSLPRLLTMIGGVDEADRLVLASEGIQPHEEEIHHQLFNIT